MVKHSLFEQLPDASAQEQFETLLQTPGIRIERIVSCGQTTADGQHYDQADDEWVLLLQGQATLLLLEPEETVELVAGDYLFIPAHRKHRVSATSQEPPCIWLALHLATGK